MPKENLIHHLLATAFRPVFLQVQNISAQPDKSDAFAVDIVSPYFEGMSTSKRYTAVGDVLYSNTDGGISLLQLSCKTPAEAR